MLDFGLLFMRIGLGIIFMAHGLPKLTGGMQSWHWLGSQMALFGIQFFPVLWGFLAAFVEFFGGILLILGIGMRYTAFLLLCVMLVATAYHINKGDAFSVYSHPLSLAIVFIGFLFTGPGVYTISSLK